MESLPTYPSTLPSDETYTGLPSAPYVIGEPPLVAMAALMAARTLESRPSAVLPAIQIATIRAPAIAAKSALFWAARRWTRA